MRAFLSCVSCQELINRCVSPSKPRGHHCSCHPSRRWVRRLHGARAPRSHREMSFAAGRSAAPAGRCEGGLRGPRPRTFPGGASRLSARSARVATRGGCAGGAAVGGRGTSAGGLACSVRGVARLGGGVEARRAPRRRRDPRPGLRRCPGWLFVRRQTRGRPRRSRNEFDAGGRRGRAGGLQRGA